MEKISKKIIASRKESRRNSVILECYSAWKQAKSENPEKYPESRPALNRTQATYWEGYSTYWAKCKYGHVAERTVKKSSCPICENISKSIRSVRIRGGNTVPLNRDEKQRIFEIYAEARKLTSDTKIPHHVDHIKPLAAGGVHHPNNLNVIPASENLSKGSLHNGSRKNYPKKEKKRLREEFISQQKILSSKNNKNKKSGNSNIVSAFLFFIVALMIVKLL